MNTLIVADVSNLYYTIRLKFPGRKLDYQKYLDKFRSNPYHAIAYGAGMGRQADGFKESLMRVGYTVRYKEPKILPSKRKADWDVGIAIDVVKLLYRFDRLVLGSADSDMVPLVEYVQQLGKPCVVYACNIAHELIQSANTCIEIEPDVLYETD
jgi:uncharacterized LabA/DUF88 family protein